MTEVTSQLTSFKGRWLVYMLRRNVETNKPVGGRGNRTLYVGMSNNIAKRLQEHNSNQSKATRGYNWNLVAYVFLENRTAAATVEQWLKVGDTAKKRSQFENLFGLESSAEDEQQEAFVKKALLWQASQKLRQGIFKGVRGNV